MTTPTTAPPWELVLLPLPQAYAAGAEWPAMLVIAEARSGALRLAEPMEGPEGLDAAIGRAIHHPPSALRPGRPRSVACGHRILPLVQPSFGARSVLCHGSDRLPAAMSAAQQVLVGAMRPGLPTAGIGWERVVQALVATRPWDQLEIDEGLRLLDRSGELDGWVVVFAGPPLRTPAIFAFPDLETWHESWDPDPTVVGEVPCARMVLEAPDSATAELDARLQLQPIRVDGQELKVLAVEGGLARTPPPEAQRALVRACEAALALLRAKGGAPALGAAAEKVPGQAGLRIERVAAPIPPEPAAPALRRLEDEVDYAVFMHDGSASKPELFPDRLVLRALHKDCPALIAALEGAQTLELRLDAQGGWLASAWPAAGPGVALGRLDLGSLPAALREGGLELAVANGGAKVGRVKTDALQWRRRLTVRCLVADGQPFEAAMANPDPLGTVRGGTWAGPPSSWPPFSAVLLAFLGPLLPTGSDHRYVRELATAAAWVWEISASEADGLDTRWARAQLEELVGPFLNERLLQRKARLFGKDLRYLRALEVMPDGTEFRLAVKWLPLSGPARAT
jgi:hypothetical protein